MTIDDNIPQVGERTRNLAWFMDGLRPMLRRPAADITDVSDTATTTTATTTTLEMLLRPAVPAADARPGVGRHRRRSPSPVSWIRNLTKRAIAK